MSINSTGKVVAGDFGSNAHNRPPAPPEPPDMEARLSTVEQAVVRIDGRLDTMDGRLSRVEVKLEHIDGEVSNLKWWLAGATLTIVLSTVATVVGTGIGIQQMTVATFQAAGAQNQPAQPPAPIIINVPAAPPATAPR